MISQLLVKLWLLTSIYFGEASDTTWCSHVQMSGDWSGPDVKPVRVHGCHLLVCSKFDDVAVVHDLHLAWPAQYEYYILFASNYYCNHLITLASVLQSRGWISFTECKFCRNHSLTTRNFTWSYWMTYRTSVQAPKEPNNVPKNIHQQLTTRHLWDEIAMVITLVAGKDKAQKTFSNFHKGLCIRSMNLN